MNLVGYTATALSRNDIEDTPTNKNVVDFAIVELKDLQGNLVVIYDDAEGVNPETQKTCDTNGQVTFFAEVGDYILEINGKAQRINLSSGLAKFISTSDGSSVQERFNGLGYQFESVEDMKSYESLSDLIGSKVSTKEYHTGTGYGGAKYVVVPSGSVTPNDIDVIQCDADPSVAAVLAEKDATPEMYGVYADGTPNDVARLVEVLSSEKNITPRAGATYSVDGVVDIEDKNVSIQSSSATFLFNTDDAQINFNYEYTDIQNITAVDNTAAINMSDGTAATETPVTKVTVADGSAYAAGDSVKIVADDVIAGSDPSDNNKVGEHAHVYSVSGNEIYLGSRLVANGGAYNTNPRIAKNSTKTFDCGSFKVDGASAGKTTRNVTHIVVRGCAKPEFTGRVESKDTQAAFLNLLSCNEPQVSCVASYNGVTDAAVGAFAHSILLTAGTTNFFIDAVYGRRMRHLVDTTAYPTGVTDDVHQYGGVVGGFCQSILGVEMQAPPASTHNDSDNIRFGTVVSINPVHGVSGYLGCVGLRGRNHYIGNADCDEGVGVYAFTDYNDPDNSRGHSVGKIRTSNKGLLDRGRAFQVRGDTLAPVDIEIGEVTWLSAGNVNKSYIGSATNGTASVESVTARGGSISTAISLFEINENATIEIEKFKGRELGTFNLADFRSDSATFIVREADIQAGVQWGRLATMNNHDAKLRISNCTIDVSGQSSDLIQDRGAGADIIADWVVTADQNTAVRNRKRLPTLSVTAATAYGIDVSDCGNGALFQKVIATAAGSIGDVSDGNFYGQEIIISNDFTSSSSFTIPDNQNGIRLGATITLQPSYSARVFWTGFQWVLA